MKKLLSFVATALVVASVHAQTIAVLGFESDSFNLESRTATMSDLLTDEFVNNDDIVVVERQNIGKVLSEMDFQQTMGYTDPETAKSIGKMLNADCVITGNVNMTGNKMTVTARTIDVETARILSSSKMTCVSWAEFNRNLPKFAADCVKKNPHAELFCGNLAGKFK